MSSTTPHPTARHRFRWTSAVLIAGLGLALVMPAHRVIAAERPSATPSPASSPSRTPHTFAAIRDGRVVVLSSSTGRVLRYLTGARSVGGDTSPAVDDRRRVVYFTRTTGTCNASLLAVPYGGGRARVVDRSPGRHFYPIPDRSGQRLAYLTYSCEPGSDMVTVRDLRTGRTRGLTVPSANAELQSMTWVQNRSVLAVVVWRLDLPEQPTELRLLDVRRSGSVLQGRLVTAAAGCVFTQIARRGPRNELAAAEICLVDGERFQRLVAVDPVAGTRGRVLATVPADQGFVNSLDADGSGRHLIYMAVSPAGGPTAYALQGGTTRRLAADVAFPTW
jgi:hypothetical protein